MIQDVDSIEPAPGEILQFLGNVARVTIQSTQQTRDVEAMLTVLNNQHWLNVSCLLRLDKDPWLGHYVLFLCFR